MRQLDHFIVGGASAPAARTHQIWNPSTGEVQAEVPPGDAALLDRAVAAVLAASVCDRNRLPQLKKAFPSGPKAVE